MEELTKKIDSIALDVSFMKGEQSQYLPNIKNMISNHETRILNQEKITENIRTKAGVAGVVSGGLIAVVIAYFSSKFH